MSRRALFFLPLLLLLAATAGLAVADPIDLTTFDWTWGSLGPGTEQSRVARYTTFMGTTYGETCGWYHWNGTAYDTLYRGAYDYVSHRGNAAPWWHMNNGISNNNATSECSCTYSGTDAEDFIGYQFKLAATITRIDFYNRIYYDGGTFDVAPRGEVLSAPLKRGGTWSEIAVAWNTSYNDAFETGNPIRPYTITPNAPTGEVWGVRLIGAPESNPGASDETGFIGLAELRVMGESPIRDTIDLTTNLALNQTPLWTGTTTHYNRPQILTDGCYAASIVDYYGSGKNYTGYDDTYGADTRDGVTYNEEYLGVAFDSPKSNVAAIGMSHKMFWVTSLRDKDGGWILPDTLVVEYTTDDGATWTPVTGLDTGRWAEDEPELKQLPWSYVHTELFTFDTIAVAIDGIRMRGTPYGAGMGSDATGFLGSVEFEVFAAVPEPSTLALLAGLALAGLARRVRRR